MVQLAIKGHPTRGNEVIELLEMLGGVNSNEAFGDLPNNWNVGYYIFDGVISVTEVEILTKKGCKIYTLEDFLNKFPYKVGDKVIYTSEVFTIIGMKWDCNRDIVIYTIKNNCGIIDCYDSTWIKPYKEKIKEENKIFNEILDTLSSYLIDFMTPQGIDKCIKYIRENMDEYNKEELKEAIKIAIPKGYEFSEVNNQHVVFTKIQSQYPKTYVECAKLIDCFGAAHIDGYKGELLDKFQELLICRDAYWKIAGKQMGLGKLWKQDYNDRCFIIANNNGNIHTYEYHGSNNVILAFPIKEMRDAFYENFKDLIEECKELL